MSASREKKQRQDSALGGPSEKQRREMQEAQKARNKKILYWAAGIVAAILVIALLVWNSGIFQRKTPAATVGDQQYSVADVSFYYNNVKNSFINNQEQYANLYSQFGMNFTRYYDTSLSPADQTVTAETLTAMASIGLSGPEEGETFDAYFRRQALDSLQYEVLMCAEAKAENYTLSAEGEQEIKDTIKQFQTYADQNSVTMKVYLRAVYGEYMTESVFKEHLTNSTLASEYQQHKLDSYSYSDDDLTAYYKENAASMDSYEYRLAFISGEPETQTDADGNTIEPTDAEKTAAMADAKAKAETMATLVRGGADFNETAQQYVAETSAEQYADPEYNHKTGDLGSNMSLTSYGAWLSDGTHKAGDVGVVEESGATGYYVVQFLNSYLDEETLYSVDIRHILVKAETTPAPTDTTEPDASPAPESTEAVTPTEEQYEAAKAKIEDIKAEWESGDKTAESFGELAAKYSEDPSSKDNGGLYEGVTHNQMFTDFDAWIFDPARVSGDVGIVKNPQQDQWGYHLIYFQNDGPLVWKHTAETALRSEDYQAWFDGMKAEYPTAELADGMDMLG